MSRATTIVPVSESRVLTGYRASSARISAIGRLRSIDTTSVASAATDAGSGRYCAGSVSSASRKTPSAVILPSACRSAEQETAIATGQDAPCRGSLITRTSWQKYLPPNCAPIPIFLVMSRTVCSSSTSRKPLREHRALGRQRVQVPRRRVLGRLERVLGAGPADDDREVVRRAGRRPDGADLLLEERGHPRRVQHRLGLLVQVRLVGRAAALGHEQELVGVPVGRVQLDLRGQVGARVLLVPHGQRRHLGVAQVQLGVGVVDAAGEVLLVPPVGEDLLAALAHHDRGAGVLAHRQHPARRDVRVLQQVARDVPVVRRRLGVVQDGPQLPQVRGAQQVGDVPERRAAQQRERLRVNFKKVSSERTLGYSSTVGDLPVGGVVVPEREQIGEGKLSHGPSLGPSGDRGRRDVGRVGGPS